MNGYKSLTVCLFGFGENEEGGRAWMVRDGLKENSIIITECRTNASGIIAKYRDLYRTWNSIVGKIDAVYVIFMGYYLMPLAWYLAHRRGVPIILDALVSQYDTEVSDRKRISRYHPRAWFLWIVDFISCRMADAIIVDTFEHKKFFAAKFYVRKEKIIVVPIGCRYDIFKPSTENKKEYDDFIIEFHGRFIPLQGIQYILEAAKILQDKNEHVRFEIFGDGQTYDQMRQLKEHLQLTNVIFFGNTPQKEIPRAIARADVCLGIFGTTEKALRVVPHKVYECLSCGKPVITGRSPAALALLHDGGDVCLVEPGNSADLAEKILELKHDDALRIQLGEQARAISLDQFSTPMIVKSLVYWLESRS